MSFSIQTNVNSLVAQENLRVNSEFQSRTINRLTSGYRINSSGDDAAGLAVANKFRSDIAELAQGVRNANDGLSVLQIIDGGTNNISKMLDRLKTLATQSASTTFTGDRNTLNNEYRALLGEIDRQATNIKMNGGGLYNSQIDVYIGGASGSQSNAKVSIDLRGNSNAVDSGSLGLASSSLVGGGVAMGSVAMNATSKYLNNSGTQDFAINTGSGSTTIQVVGDADGLTRDEVLSQLNSKLSPHGISASVNDSGVLQFSGASAFTIRSAGGGGAIVTADTAVRNASMYALKGNLTYAPTTAANTETLTFKKDGVTKSVTLNDTTGGSIDAAISNINANVSSLGIYAVKSTAGDGTAATIEFQSASSFNLDVTSAGAGAATTGLFDDAAGGPTSKSMTQTPAAGADAVGTSQSAITLIDSAVKRLGVVQGKVGTGQNQLQYAIQLANSQIGSFSAAESRIRDADVASEAANLTKAQVLQQASLAAMAQANSAPQAVMALLRG